MSTLAELFQQAVQYHQGGKLMLAEPLYRQVLHADPTNAEAHHLLGLLAHQAGQSDAAVDLLRQALALNPATAGVQFNLGIVFMSREQFTEAALCFERVLQLEPQHVEALINLGNAHLNLGQNAAASACYRQALRLQPNHADAHINLGNALLSQGLHTEAIGSYREALRLNPRHAHAHNNLGNALMSLGQFADAEASFRAALQLDPTNANALNNLGRALRDHGDALAAQSQFAEAAVCFQQALSLGTPKAEIHNRLGRVLFWQGKFAEAAACNRQALCLDPDNGEALNNLGLALRDQGYLGDAAECFQRALDIDFGQGVALWNRCLLRLLQGDFAGGWPDFDQRMALPGAAVRHFPQPRWDGSPLQGKTILVYAELGLGDTIHFARFLPLVKARGGTVIFECQPTLVNSPRGGAPSGGFAGLAGIDQLIAAGDPLPPFDVHVPLLSLPALFGITLATLTVPVPYMTANPRLVEHWRRELFKPEPSATEVVPENAPCPQNRSAIAGPRLNIGIAWQANLHHRGQLFKSVSLKFFEPLARVPGVRLISLQVGQGTAQLVSAPFPVEDLGSRFDPGSMDDLAAAMMNLDLVVSIDTAVPHLAGALGVPVWVALPLVACWRWLRDREDSPWYPSMRLFRQKTLGDWAEVFERIARELRKRSEESGVRNQEKKV